MNPMVPHPARVGRTEIAHRVRATGNARLRRLTAPVRSRRASSMTVERDCYFAGGAVDAPDFGTSFNHAALICSRFDLISSASSMRWF